jgi:hypothetical protein
MCPRGCFYSLLEKRTYLPDVANRPGLKLGMYRGDSAFAGRVRRLVSLQEEGAFVVVFGVSRRCMAAMREVQSPFARFTRGFYRLGGAS